jgi:predicted nucleotidyltransferase
LVDLTRPWTLLDRIGLTQDLEDLLGWTVDIVVADKLVNAVRRQALNEAVPL